MANRYWVGGTDNWNGTAGSKWATTSGGAGGAAEPTNADDVYFDANSGNNTITVAAGGTRVPLSIDCTGFTGTLTGTGNVIVGGSAAGQSNIAIKLVSGMTFSCTGSWSWGGSNATTQTFTSAGKTFVGFDTNNAGTSATIQLQDNITFSSDLTIAAGTFDINGKTVTISTHVGIAGGSTTRVLALGTGGVINGSQSAYAIYCNGTVTNFSVTGTGTMTFTGSAPLFQGGGANYAGSGITIAFTGSPSITGANTFYALSMTSRGGKTLTLPASTTTTVTNALTLTGTSFASKLTLNSDSSGTAATISCGSSVTITMYYVAVKDWTATGGGSFIAYTSTDTSGNTGITFLPVPVFPRTRAALQHMNRAAGW